MSRIAIAPIVACAIMVLISIAPLAGGVHVVTKGTQGPSASAVSWDYIPPGYGTWVGHVTNDGLRSLVIDVYDNTTGVPEEIMHQKIRFAECGAFPNGAVDTCSITMSPSHRYVITATPNGARGSSCTVEDLFTIPSPPIATFTISVEYLTVYLDASASYDPDGFIVSYSWTFGDGQSASGVTTYHTYAMPGYYCIKLTLVDDDGLKSSTTIDVIAADLPTAHVPCCSSGDGT